MIHARVVGHAHSTIHHASMRGVKLLLCEAVTETGTGTGRYSLAADWQGAGIGSRVMITTDGSAASGQLNSTSTPVRNVVLGILDPTPGEGMA